MQPAMLFFVAHWSLKSLVAFFFVAQSNVQYLSLELIIIIAET